MRLLSKNSPGVEARDGISKSARTTALGRLGAAGAPPAIVRSVMLSAVSCEESSTAFRFSVAGFFGPSFLDVADFGFGIVTGLGMEKSGFIKVTGTGGNICDGRGRCCCCGLEFPGPKFGNPARGIEVVELPVTAEIDASSVTEGVLDAEAIITFCA